MRTCYHVARITAAVIICFVALPVLLLASVVDAGAHAVREWFGVCDAAYRAVRK